MKSYIKAIIIFNKNGEKRVVPLEQGVNIITGYPAVSLKRATLIHPPYFHF